MCCGTIGALTKISTMTTADEAALKSLETRRSVPTPQLGEPGPRPDELHRILNIASRVPDHGALVPFRFIVFAGPARQAVGQLLSQAYRKDKAGGDPEKLEKFAGIMERVFTYAPLVILVVSSPEIAARIPVREQETVSGAVSMNLLNAIHAHGYGANLVTGWTADSPAAGQVFGLKSHERVVGVVHVGTIIEPPNERPRPDVAKIVSFWKPPV